MSEVETPNTRDTSAEYSVSRAALTSSLRPVRMDVPIRIQLRRLAADKYAARRRFLKNHVDEPARSARQPQMHFDEAFRQFQPSEPEYCSTLAHDPVDGHSGFSLLMD